MANTSPEALARELLGYCLRGERWPAALLEALRGSDSLIRIVAEGLSDRFEPHLSEAYADLFSDAFGLGPQAAERWRRARLPRPIDTAPSRVVVLSRVTLGADVAVSSVFLSAAKRAFPAARIEFAGARKNWELFGADPAIGHLPVSYRRDVPLAHIPELRANLFEAGTIVVDPDSRLTQLGLIEVCPEENYRFFDSRGYGGHSDEALGALAVRWAKEVFGAEGRAFISPVEPVDVAGHSGIAVSLGVGENPAKRIPDPFEQQLLALLEETGERVWIDRGAGGEESARVEQAIAGFPAERLRVWQGSFAGFASIIAQSKLYVGYDSAGQHVAAACGVPLITVFTGFPVERMFHRWTPSGPGPIHVVRVERPDPAAVLNEVRQALRQHYGQIG